MRGHDGALPPYPFMSLAELASALHQTTTDLISAIDEKTTVDKTAEGARVNGYYESGASTERGRDMDARRSALPSTMSSIDLDATIRMLTEEKYLILKIIDLRVSGAL